LGEARFELLGGRIDLDQLGVIERGDESGGGVAGGEAVEAADLVADRGDDGAAAARRAAAGRGGLAGLAAAGGGQGGEEHEREDGASGPGGSGQKLASRPKSWPAEILCSVTCHR